MKLIQTLLVTALMGLSFAASAQWQWLDKDGRKVFSDRAPPADIQEKNILKRPGIVKRPAQSADAATEPDAAASAPVATVPNAPASSAGVGGVDKELEAKKKQALDAEAAKRKAANEQYLKAKIENCARAKESKAKYESGVRVGRVNSAGEREIMDEAARAEELKRIQAILNKDCN